MSWVDKEIEQLDKDLIEGLITDKEYHDALQEITEIWNEEQKGCCWGNPEH